MTHIWTGSPPQPLTVNSRVSPSATRVEQRAIGRLERAVRRCRRAPIANSAGGDATGRRDRTRCVCRLRETAKPPMRPPAATVRRHRIGQVQPVQPLPAAILDQHVQRRAVGCPRAMCVVARSSRGGEAPRATAAAIEQRQPALIVERALQVERVPEPDARRPANSADARRKIRCPPSACDDARWPGSPRRCRPQFIMPRLASARSTVTRELAAVRADVVMLGGRIPGLQRETGAGEQVARVPGGDVGGEDMRLAAVGQPVIPEAELVALGDMRLDLGLLALFAALRPAPCRWRGPARPRTRRRYGLLSGNQRSADAPVGKLVSRRASPPSGAMR